MAGGEGRVKRRKCGRVEEAESVRVQERKSARVMEEEQRRPFDWAQDKQAAALQKAGLKTGHYKSEGANAADTG